MLLKINHLNIFSFVYFLASWNFFHGKMFSSPERRSNKRSTWGGEMCMGPWNIMFAFLQSLSAFCCFSGVHTRNIFSEIMFTHRWWSSPCFFFFSFSPSSTLVCVCKYFKFAPYICSLCSAGDISGSWEAVAFFPTAFFFAFVLLPDSFFSPFNLLCAKEKLL